ncbi:hypothetical protein RJ640_021750 [Escallonia rubra]|uniref:COBRA C-terminal domain-containing protein n=1 Tax=Escallonia rubra TaxID=112253 RepID=A0AA88ULM0_9ASTE|nr:hypothetical protein RJ640_021750 [Escallonia rubra]
MCPIRVHWHVKANYKEYWLYKIAITNFNYGFDYSQWTLVAQHPNLDCVSRVYSFVYKPLLPYQSINKIMNTVAVADDSGMFYGTKKLHNYFLLEAGPDGNVQTEILLQKDMNTFTLKRGWAFPRKIYFNGDECMMPLPDSYPSLPNSALHAHQRALPTQAILVSVAFFIFGNHFL